MSLYNNYSCFFLALSLSVCMSVSLSVCLCVCVFAYIVSQKSEFNFHQRACTCYLCRWLGPTLTAIQYVMLCISGFVDDVMFSHRRNRANGPESKTNGFCVFIFYYHCHIWTVHVRLKRVLLNINQSEYKIMRMFRTVRQMAVPVEKSAISDCVLFMNEW